MRIVSALIILLFSLKTMGQNKHILYYSEEGKRISGQQFKTLRNYNKNLDLYFENDSTQVGLLVTREKYGHLDSVTAGNLKLYLTQISGKSIDSTDNIVVNFLTYRPEEENASRPLSKHNVLYKDYLKGLHKSPNINQFWIGSGESDLSYLQKYEIDYTVDEEGVFKILFFPYEVKYGNFILIKPDGSYYYYLGEHSKSQIWEKSRRFFE